METLSIRKRKDVNQWNKNYISPGAVGSVGDIVQNVRLKQSCPELATRWEFDKTDVKQRGSGVADGSVPNNYTDAFSSTTVNTNYYNSPNTEYVIGRRIQDLRLNDLAATTRELGAPQFGWRSTQAVTSKARVMGDKFLPLPNGYPRSGISRGPEPRSTFLVDTTVGGKGGMDFTNPQVAPVQPQLDPNNPMLAPGGGATVGQTQTCLNNTTGPTPTPTGINPVTAGVSAITGLYPGTNSLGIGNGNFKW